MVLAVGAAAGLVLAANHADGTVRTIRPADVSSAGQAAALTQSQVICPGPDRPGSAIPQADQRVDIRSAAAPASLTGGGGPATIRVNRLPAAIAGTPVVPTAAGQAAGSAVSGAGAVTVLGSGQPAAGLTATQSALERNAQHRGLRVLSCPTALTTQAWLFAGGAAAGRVVRVVLSNPNEVAITARLLVVGSAGIDPTVSVPAVSVPAGSRSVVTLGAFPAALADAAIRVTTAGGPASIAVSDSWSQGESAVGEEFSGPAGAAATTQVIPAVGVVGGAAQVRVVVPGATNGIVRVQAVGADGLVVADQVATVPAGTVGRVALSGVPDGVYALRVTADQPIVAAAISTSGTSDFAWSVSATALSDSSALLLPQLPTGSTATLSLASAGSARVTLTTVAPDGTPTDRAVHVAADRPTQLTLAPGTSAWLRVERGTVWAGAFVRVPDTAGQLVSGVALSRVPLRATGQSVSELVR